MTSNGGTDPPPVVFIHGLWMHATSWVKWVDLFNRTGYRAIAPGWPGDADTVEAARANPGALDNRGIAEVTDHYADILADLSDAVVIGHSFGGLIAQRLLGAGRAAACVAIAPAQFKGVLALLPTQLETALPILAHPDCAARPDRTPATASTAASLTASIAPRRAASTTRTPAPARPLFQAVLANLAPHREAAVDTRAKRGPLLMIAGGQDRTVPEATVRSAYKIEHRHGGGLTELKVYPDRSHVMPADHGRRDIADTALDFLGSHGFAAASGPAAG